MKRRMTGQNQTRYYSRVSLIFLPEVYPDAGRLSRRFKNVGTCHRRRPCASSTAFRFPARSSISGGGDTASSAQVLHNLHRYVLRGQISSIC
ncbi:hypothetical protein KCP74_17035 [Salmonella enterica subsp. enterica]|nr:hypothetical protein KCP74_17035 [Salmonella enterica subsp. enterica]